LHLKSYLKTALFIIPILLLSGKVSAQSVVRGIITDASNSTPMAAANVVLLTLDEEIYQGTATDVNGFFIFNNVDEGDYIIRSTFIGYETFSDTLTVGSFGEAVNFSIEMSEADNQLDDIVITQRGNDADTDVGQLRIDKIDIQRIPTPAGSGDLASYIQTLPGVVSTGDRGGNLFIRGGLPSENLTLIDGAYVYQPFHIVGFFSVFPEEIVSTADFYAGGFGPKYAGRTSSVLDVKLRNGDLYNRHWSASVSTFLSQIYYESPIKKGESAIMVSARKSLIEEVSGLYTDEQPLNFNSQLIKFNKKVNDYGSNCSALIMRTKDKGKLDYQRGEEFRWNNFVIGGKCSGLSKETSVSYLDFNMYVSHFSNEIGEVNDPSRRSNITTLNTQLNIVQTLDRIRFEYGFYTALRWMDYMIDDQFIDLNSESQSILGSGAYFQAIIPFFDQKVSLKPGIGMSAYLFKYGVTVDPRIQVSYKPRGKDNEELSAVFGFYRQPVTGLSDFRDAGTAFTLWTSVPSGGDQVLSKHAMIGWRQPLGDFFDYSIEGYLKLTDDLPISTWSSVARFNTELSLAEGRTRGIDLKLNYDGNVFYASAGYGYVITEFTTSQDIFVTWFGEEDQTFNPPHDRRHQLSLQGGLDFKKFRINILWNYGSGLPYTRPYGFDDYINFDYTIPDVQGDFGVPRIILDTPYNGRLPEYHQLNVSVEKSFDLNNILLKLQGGAINTYDQRNIFYYDIFTQRRIDQMPLFPFASIKVETKR
jgi:hypothetical protein